MKNRTTAIVVALTLGVCASSSAQTGQSNSRTAREAKATTLYQQGVVAMRGGHYETAKLSFREVLRLYPKHLKAKQNLLYLLENKDTLELNKRKAALKKIVIPSVDLDKATVQESLQMLGVQITRESKKKVSPNFIVQDPKGSFKERAVTLRLNNVPAETLLNYIVSQVGAKVRYDSHAIIISPRQQAGSGTAKSSPAKPVSGKKAASSKYFPE